MYIAKSNVWMSDRCGSAFSYLIFLYAQGIICLADDVLGDRVSLPCEHQHLGLLLKQWKDKSK